MYGEDRYLFSWPLHHFYYHSSDFLDSHILSLPSAICHLPERGVGSHLPSKGFSGEESEEIEEIEEIEDLLSSSQFGTYVIMTKFHFPCGVKLGRHYRHLPHRENISQRKGITFLHGTNLQIPRSSPCDFQKNHFMENPSGIEPQMAKNKVSRTEKQKPAPPIFNSVSKPLGFFRPHLP